MNAPTTVTVNNKTLEIAGSIGSSPYLLTKSGNGTLQLDNPNGNTGGVTVNAGTLTLGNPAALGTGTLTMNGGALDNTLPLTTANSNPQIWNGSFAYVDSGNLGMEMSGTSVTLTSDVTITTVNANNGVYLQIDGSIYGPTHSLTKAGPGLLVFNGTATSTYSNTIVNAGQLYLYNATLATNSTVKITSPGTMDLGFTGNNVVTALFTNGVAVAPGLYNSGNLPAFFASDIGSLQVLTTPVIVIGPSGPGYLTNSLSGSALSFSWPAGQGWRLQAQTNSLSIGLSNNWFYVTDGTVNTFSTTVNPTNPAVYYRLTYP
jgi:autotransporter-associated beta strand protein